MRKFFVGIGVLVGLFVVLVIGVVMFFDVNKYKPQIEQQIAKATGLTLKVNGPASLKIFPHIGVALSDVHVTNPAKRGTEIFAVKEFRVGPELFAYLFHKEVIIDQVALIEPKIHVERDAKGKMNFETAQMSRPAGHSQGTGPGQVHAVKLEDGDITYADRSSGQNVHLSRINVSLADISWSSPDLMKSISLKGDAKVQTIQDGKMNISDLKTTIHDDHGLIEFSPLNANVFGGSVDGKLQVDMRGKVPKIAISETISHIELTQAAPQMKDRVTGKVDGSLELTASGLNPKSLTKTANGSFALHSESLMTSINLDDLGSNLIPHVPDLAHLASSLIPGRAAQQAGQVPGHEAAPSGPKNAIRHLVSNWKITNGMAETQDVALATDKTKVAFKGDANLVTERYQNFYIATIDDKGCSKFKVEVTGSLDNPKPVLGAAARELAQPIIGSVGRFFSSALGQSPQAKAQTGCDQFYSGSVI
jgi:AsmA protein